tara:strand:- start:111 stop:1232 length:1122 start_codon:yes stop_codon:yes gene_type:complete
MSLARDIADLGSSATRLDTEGANNKNLVINGNMQISQRGSFTISTTGSPEYGGPDRFHVWTYASTEQVVADVSSDSDVPSGLGFSNSYKFDVTTAESAVASNEALLIGQYIEAQNLQHLEYGTSSAKNLTLSFHIKSTKTGIYCLSVTAPDGSRNIIKEYTVSASNTWEKKTILIPGDTSGTINNDNGQGLWLQWVLIAGTDRHKAADSWSGTTSDIATSNQVNACDSTSNNIYLAGVQLELGDTATDFEHRLFGDELARCQRYYFQETTTPADASGILGVASGAAAVVFNQTLPVQMRANPSVSLTSTNLRIGDMVAAGFTTTSGTIAIGTFSGSTSVTYTLGGFSGLTSYRSYLSEPDATSTGLVKSDAEL